VLSRDGAHTLIEALHDSKTMSTRRAFVASTPWLVDTRMVLAGCHREADADDYEAVAERTWMPNAVRALQATALGIRNAFLNQPVEVAALRPHFAAALGLGDQRPDLVVRFGRGPAMPRSLRRPVDAVLV
jgi:hypothetical protein